MLYTRRVFEKRAGWFMVGNSEHEVLSGEITNTLNIIVMLYAMIP